MFKERLKIMGKKLATGLMNFGIALVAMSIYIGGMYLAMTFAIAITIMEWLIVLIVSLVVLVLLFIIGMHIYNFINWLFIEPYKEKKKGDKE